MALEFLAPVAASPIGVDPAARTIKGVVVAQSGPFDSGRGEFDATSHRQTVRLINSDPRGIKSRLGHPNPQHPGSKDELLAFAGRFSNARVDGDKVRSDVRLDDTAFLTPPGGGTSHGDYLLARAKSDPASLATSLVLTTDKEWRLDNHGKPRRDNDGNVLPPLWRPQEISAIDFVDKGDATPNGLLAAGSGIVSGDELLRLRQSWRHRLVTADGLSALTAGDNVPSASAGGFIPPAHSAGQAVPGPFVAPKLSDFTMREFSALSEADRKKIAGYFAWAASLNSFGDLHLPYRFATGPARGRASLNGIKAALARLNQTAAIPAAKRDDVAKFLRSFLPGLGYR